MKRGVKIQFSQEELRCMDDTEFLASKRLITEKLYDLLYELSETLKASPVHKNFKFPAGTDYQTGKISRGENYKGLPYVILDFPRLFDKNDVFVFRTIFWWGNYFSFTLQLKGMPLDQFRDSLQRNLKQFNRLEVLLYNGNDEWEHDLTDKNYVQLDKASRVDFSKMGFVKLSRKEDIKDYQKLLKKGKETYESFLKILAG